MNRQTDRQHIVEALRKVQETSARDRHHGRSTEENNQGPCSRRGGRGRVSPHSSLKIKEVSQHKAGLSGFPVGAGKGMDGGQELTTQGEEPWYLDIC